MEDPTESFQHINKKDSRGCALKLLVVWGIRETINHHLEKNINQIPEGKKIGNSLYVDHVSTGANEPKSATELYETAKSIIAEANMNLRKWRRNKREVNYFIEGKHESIEELSEDTSYASLMLNSNEESKNKVLGIP